MDLGLTGKSVLVSGASRGIGNRIALAFAAEGARLCLSGRTEETLTAAAEAVAAAGAADVAHYVGDMARTEDAGGFVDTAVSRLGGVDILVNNVGGSVWTPFAEITDDEWLHVFNLSFFSAVRVSRAAFPALERSGGSIVNVSSIFGRETGGPVSYNAAKAAMISMTANLAREAAAKGVRVNSVAPGSIVFPGGQLGAPPEGGPRGHRPVRGGEHPLRPLRHARRGGGRGRLPGLRAGELGDGGLPQRRRRAVQVEHLTA